VALQGYPSRIEKQYSKCISLDTNIEKYVLINTDSSKYLSNISTTLISLFLVTRELMRSKALSYVHVFRKMSD
jgi:hypothetical protein